MKELYKKVFIDTCSFQHILLYINMYNKNDNYT